MYAGIHHHEIGHTFVLHVVFLGECLTRPWECICNFLDEDYGTEILYDFISYDEALACYMILINSEMLALNCESP